MSLSSARRSQGVALGATLVMFVLALLLTAAVVAVLRFKRRLDDARRAEIDRAQRKSERDLTAHDLTLRAMPGILSLDAGQTEAAQALGLSYRQAMAFVVLPQALRRMLPAIVSQLAG